MIFYSSPYSLEMQLGVAYNQFLELLPCADDFACLIDADAMFTITNYGHILVDAIQRYPQQRIFYARTNRIACRWQLDKTIQGDDLREHRKYGQALASKHGSSCRVIPRTAMPGSGFFILLRKDLWQEYRFKETGILGVDWDFYRRIVATGERILQLQGIYLYHWYRGGNSKQTSHLQSHRKNDHN